MDAIKKTKILNIDFIWKIFILHINRNHYIEQLM